MTCSLPSTALSQLATMAENVWENQADWSWVTVMRGVSFLGWRRGGAAVRS